VFLHPTEYIFTVNLESQTISTEQGLQIQFDVDPYRKTCLLKGLDDIAITLEKKEKIKCYEIIKNKTLLQFSVKRS
jgi:3-isopropylmalate/(R)-2-methylmalate dehydratase small subunit